MQENIFVIGHKNPDTDSICSAIAYAELKCKITGEKYTAARCGEVNAETSYVLERFGINEPEFVASVEPQTKLILVDHNETTQAVDGLAEAELLEIIDHHKIGDIQTMMPIYFRNQPVGCTATIVTLLYKENKVEIAKETAGLLCAAILSDTLLFRSPTCTPLDKETALELAAIAGVEVEEFGMAMFKAGSNLKDKTAEEIFYQDFKKFNAGEVSFGVGQINAMSDEELVEIKEKLYPYLETAKNEHELQMVFFMLTDIMTETTSLICLGEGSDELVVKAYNQEKTADNRYMLKDVVSRKKQLIPAFMAGLQAQI